jgi:cephalosporin hydroxylase
MSKRIEMIEGSSISMEVFEKVLQSSKRAKKILVCLDSNHTHDHVLEELKLYAPLVSKGSYCIVFDTMVENLPDGKGPLRPWGRSNNPKTAVHEFLNNMQKLSPLNDSHQSLEFEIDKQIENQLLITVCPDGYLRRI